MAAKPKFYHGPLGRTRALVGHHRSEGSDLALATMLAAIAGAANAGGFFALGKYTSHMTGYVSQLADNLAILNFAVAGVSVLAIGSFTSGAAFSTCLINWARQANNHHQYALPLAVQGAFLLCFSFGGVFSSEAGRLFSLACLCFIMGMQNATITKISGARIRTTHATGMVTDIGIEIGRAIFGRLFRLSGVQPNTGKLRILCRLVLSFLLGGLIGAIGYGHVGFFFSMPLAFILLWISVPTLIAGTTRPETES
ncbi:MAG: YoaK family protein [Cypionkella sp.]